MQKYVISLLVIVIPLLIASTIALPGRNRHTNYVPICYRKHGELVPMRGSCSGFFICVKGNAIASSCGSFYRFNKQTKHCDHPERVDCNQAPLIDQSLEDEGADSDDPVIATETGPIIVPAPGYSHHIPKPKDPEEVVADDAAGDICYRKRNGVFLPKLDSCSQFYVCLLQRPYRRTCPPMLHFNAERRLCQDPALAQCIPKPMDTPITLEVAQINRVECTGIPNDILLPHEDDCSKFYNCQDQQRNEMECPSGLQFSVRHQNCQWPAVAMCNV